MSDDRAIRALARLSLERYPADAARRLESAPGEDISALLAGETPETTLEVVRHLTPDRAAGVVAELEPERARRLLGALDPQRAAALLARLPAEERAARLSLLDRGLAQELRELATYPPDTAGGLMDPRVTSFRPDATVQDALARLRTCRDKRLQDVFLVDAEGHLLGAVALQDLVLCPVETRLEEIARMPCASVAAVASRELVSEEIGRASGSSLAVIDAEARLVGVLRQDELVAAAQQEATADAMTMVGAGRDERALSPAWFAVRKRLPWLQINLVTAFLAAGVVGLFEETIARVTALAVLLPVVAGQSGNTGSQALAVTLRGLALREVRTRQWLRVAVKELTVGAANGVAVALTTGVAVYLWSRSDGLAAVIMISMVLSMMAAALAGAVIPMLLTSLRQDPAQSSSIILTTVTDVVGFFSFLGVATLLVSAL
ncbi:MAG: magnesium transporter [Myxococcota bacterium]